MLFRLALGSAILAAVTAWAVPAAGGAWLRETGEYYLKVSTSYLYSRDRYNSDGDIVPLASEDPTVTAAAFRDVSVVAYLEYGVSERTTLVAQVPYKALTNWKTEFSEQFNSIREVEAVNRGMTDLRTGVRVPVLAGGTPVSFEGLVKLPLGYDPDPPETQLAPLGSGNVDVDLTVQAGASLWPFPGYVNARAGYRVRGGGLADEILATLESGANWRRLFGKIAIDATYTTGELADADPTRVVTNENILKLMAELNYDFTAWLAVSAEVFHVLQGANTVAGTTWVAGVVFRRVADSGASPPEP